MSFTVSTAFFIALALAFVRSIAWISICPPFANPSVPLMVKIALAGAIAFFAAGTLQHDALPQSDAQIVVQLVVQALVGLALGYVVSLFVSTIAAAGSLIDVFSGINLPEAIDPLSLHQAGLFSQLFNLISTTLLVTTGGAAVIVEGFMRSFQAVGTSFPPTTLSHLSNVIISDVVYFLGAVAEIAAPVVAVLFGTQILLALLAKAVPQVNVYVLGMPLQIVIGLVGVGAVIATLPGNVTNLVGRALAQLFGSG